MTTSIISIDDYYGEGQWLTHPDVTEEVMASSIVLLEKVNTVLQLAIDDRVKLKINPVTGVYVSGAFHGLGGFRPRNATQGASRSSHKEGKGIDIYDFAGDLDAWCMAHLDILKGYGLCMEHPDETPHWCHLSSRPQPNGKTVFHP